MLMPFSQKQEEIFRCFLLKLRSAGIDTGLRHMSAPAAMEEGFAMNLDAVRIGLRMFMDATYSLSAMPFVSQKSFHNVIREACALHTFLTSILSCKAGESIGYGGKIVLPSDTQIGLISIGYKTTIHHFTDENMKLPNSKKFAGKLLTRFYDFVIFGGLMCN